MSPDIEQNDSTTATDILLMAGTEAADDIRVGESATGNGAQKRLVVTIGGVGGHVVNAIWKDVAGNPLLRQIQVLGLGGDDRIELLPSVDTASIPVGNANKYVLHVSGGDGNDTVFGSVGRDQLSGGAGSDDLYGNGGDDKLWGDGLGGRDAITDTNRLFGGRGNDDLIGGRGLNALYAWSADPAPTPARACYALCDDPAILRGWQGSLTLLTCRTTNGRSSRRT